MKKINIDIETYSSVSLMKSGVCKYAESEDFTVLLFAYAVDDGEVQVVDIASGETVSQEIVSELQEDNVMKWAFNAQFGHVCLSRYFYISLSTTSWCCTMVWQAYMGLPLSLEGAGDVLGLEEQKLKTGKELIRYFCVPCAPTKTNGGRTRNVNTSGNNLKHITSEMWMLKWQSDRIYRSFQYHNLFGKSIFSIKRLTIEVFKLIAYLSNKPLKSINTIVWN